MHLKHEVGKIKPNGKKSPFLVRPNVAQLVWGTQESMSSRGHSVQARSLVMGGSEAERQTVRRAEAALGRQGYPWGGRNVKFGSSTQGLRGKPPDFDRLDGPSNHFSLSATHYLNLLFVFCFFFLIWDRVSLCCPGWPQTLGLKRFSCFSLPRSWELVYNTMPGFDFLI
jgi:hypothetical protein